MSCEASASGALRVILCVSASCGALTPWRTRAASPDSALCRAVFLLALRSRRCFGTRPHLVEALRTTVLFLDTRIDFFPVHLHFGRSFDPELHLSRADLENRDLDRISDPNV